MWIVHVTFWIKGHLKVRRLLTQLRTHFNFYSFFLNPTQSLLCQFVQQLPRPSLPCLRRVPDTPCRDSRNEKSCWGLAAVHVVQQCILVSLYNVSLHHWNWSTAAARQNPTPARPDNKTGSTRNQFSRTTINKNRFLHLNIFISNQSRLINT